MPSSPPTRRMSGTRCSSTRRWRRPTRRSSSRARGNRVWDITGKEHLDAVSGGVWTVNVGYGRTEIADRVRDELVKMCYFAGMKGTIPGAEFAERLIGEDAGPRPRLLRQFRAPRRTRRRSRSSARSRTSTMAAGRPRSSTATATTTAPPSPCLSAGGQQRAQRPVRAVRARLRRGAALPGIPRARAGWRRPRTTANGRPTRSSR